MSKILYIQTSGLDTPERLYAPFILGMTARAMDVKASIFFIIKGITALKKGESEKIKIGSFPSLKEVMDPDEHTNPSHAWGSNINIVSDYTDGRFDDIEARLERPPVRIAVWAVDLKP